MTLRPLPACRRGTSGGSDSGAGARERLIGDSRSATAGDYNKNTMGYGAIKPAAR